MKISYLGIFLFFFHFSFGQFSESFSDGNFKNNPAWTGDTTQFLVNSLQELQSNGSPANTVLSLVTLSDRLVNTSWEFLIKMPFALSASNYARIYLASDNIDLKGNLHGYFIRVGGESGNTDGIDLYRQDGGTSIKLADGIEGHAGKSDNTIRIKVMRQMDGNWEIYSDTTGGSNFSFEAASFDTTYTSSMYFGISYIHSATRGNQFFFDDLLINDVPFRALQAKAYSDSEIEVVFNMPVESIAVETYSCYDLEGTGAPSKVTKGAGGFSVILQYDSPLRSGDHKLVIKNIKSINGGRLDIQELLFHFNKPLKGNALLITEIYADPSPSNGLPGEEFLELYNTTEDTIALKGISLSDPATIAALPDIKINPGSFLILTTNEGVPLYQKFGTTVGLNPWPSLNNTDDVIELTYNNKVIYKVVYSDTWHSNSDKKEGGWSLEMIHTRELCKGASNWSSSLNPLGGSPGRPNTVSYHEPDLKGPALLSYELPDSNILVLHFDEPLDSIPDRTLLSSEDNFASSIKFSGQNLISQWSKSFRPSEKSTIRVERVKDCLGNSSDLQTIEIVRAEKADPMDIIINEILFNPHPGGEDFIEIYNRSGKVIDLKDWFIASVRSDTIKERWSISKNSMLMFPHEFKVISPSLRDLSSRYHVLYPERITESRLPSFNDSDGTAALLNPDEKAIDLLVYSEKYHSPLLKVKEGVSLERLSFFAATNSSSNWYSASSGSGYATPGYENSQHAGKSSSEIDISPKVISPNGDNYHDLAYIYYQLADPGNICNIKIFSSGGRLIRRLAENQLAGREGFFYWDGSNDTGEPVTTGIYLLLIEYFHPAKNSDPVVYKDTLVVTNDF